MIHVQNVLNVYERVPHMYYEIVVVEFDKKMFYIHAISFSKYKIQ